MELTWILTPLWVFAISLLLNSEDSVMGDLDSESSDSSNVGAVIGKYIEELEARKQANTNGSTWALDAEYMKLHSTDAEDLSDTKVFAKFVKEYLREKDISRLENSLVKQQLDVWMSYNEMNDMLGADDLNGRDEYEVGFARNVIGPNFNSQSAMLEKLAFSIVSPAPFRKGVLDMYYEKFSKKLETTTDCEELLSIKKAFKEAGRKWVQTITAGYLIIMKSCEILWEVEDEDSTRIARDAMEDYNKNVNRIEGRMREILDTITTQYDQCQLSKIE